MSKSETQPPSLVGVLGLGNAGCALIRSLHAAKIAVVAASSNAGRHQSLRPLLSMPIFTNGKALAEHLAGVPNSLLILAVPDDVLFVVAAELAAFEFLPANIAHLCGAKSLEVLNDLVERCGVAVLHPMASLQADKPVPQKTLTAVEASTPRLSAQLMSLATAMGCVATPRLKGSHTAYHCAAVIAGNLPIALLDIGIELLKDAGIDDDMARAGLAQLFLSAAQSAVEKPLSKALTGPLARRDEQTLKAHVEMLKERDAANDQHLSAIYQGLSLRLCDVVEHSSSKAEVRSIRNLLGDKDER